MDHNNLPPHNNCSRMTRALLLVERWVNWSLTTLRNRLSDADPYRLHCDPSEPDENPNTATIAEYRRRLDAEPWRLMSLGAWEWMAGMMAGFFLWVPEVAYVPANIWDLALALNVKRRVPQRWASSVIMASWFFVRRVHFATVLLSLSWMMSVDVLGNRICRQWNKLGWGYRQSIENPNDEKTTSQRRQGLWLHAAGFFVGLRLSHLLQPHLLRGFHRLVCSTPLSHFVNPESITFECSHPTPLIILSPLRHFTWLQPFLFFVPMIATGLSASP